MESKTYNVADIMKRLGLSKTTILRWEREGRIPLGRRDKLGWRYWTEEEFQKIASLAEEGVFDRKLYRQAESKIATAQNLSTPVPEVESIKIKRTEKKPLVELAKPRDPEIEPRLEDFLPKLSKSKPKIFWRPPLPRFERILIPAVLALFLALSLGFREEILEASDYFNKNFEFASRHIFESGNYLRFRVFNLKAEGNFVDEAFLAAAHALGANFENWGKDFRLFLLESFAGLREGIEELERLAFKNRHELEEGLLGSLKKTEESSIELQTFGNRASKFYLAFRDGALARLFWISEGLGEIPGVLSRAEALYSLQPASVFNSLVSRVENFFQRIGESLAWALNPEIPEISEEKVAIKEEKEEKTETPPPRKPEVISSSQIEILKSEIANLKREIEALKSQGFRIEGGRVVERIVERAVAGAGGDDVEARLESLNQTILAVRRAMDDKIQANFNAIALTQRINTLGSSSGPSVTIASPTITGTLNSLTVNNLTVTGSCTGCGGGSSNTSGWTDDGTIVRLTDAGDFVGIGTTSPAALLSVHGNALISGTTTVQTLIATSTIIVQGSATSTFTNGINLSSGCFAVNGTCVSGGGGSGTVNSGNAGLLAFYPSTGTTVDDAAQLTYDNTNSSFGIASSTPWGLLSVEALQGTVGANRPIFAVGDQGTTSPLLIIEGNQGFVGIATSSPAYRFSVAGHSLFGGNATATGLLYSLGSGTSTFSGGISTAGLASSNGLTVTGGSILNTSAATSTFSGNGLNVTTGCVALNGTCLTNLGQSIDIVNETTGTLTVARGGTGATSFTAGSIIFSDGTILTQDNASLFFDDTNNRLGLGTTTPGSIFSVQSVGNFQAPTSTLYTGLIVPLISATTSATSTFTGGLSAGGLASSNGLTITGGSILNTSTATSTFSGGLNIAGGGLTLGTLTSGSVLFAGTSGAILQDNSNFFWDDANNRFGIGTTSPMSSLTVHASTTAPALTIRQATSTNSGPLLSFLSGTDYSREVGNVRGLELRIVGSVQDSTNLDEIRGIYVSGRYAYITNDRDTSLGTEGRLTVVDVSDPTSPTVIGSVLAAELLEASDIYVVGRYAYVASDLRGLATPTGRLTIVDISNPEVPVVVSSLNSTTIRGTRGVYVQGRYAYMTSDGTGDTFAVIDISNPHDPRIVGSVTSDAFLNNTFDLVVSGKYAYVSVFTGDRLTIVDISNPTRPVIAGSITDATQLDGAAAVYVSGRYAYVTAFSSDRLTIVDVSDPRNPTITSSLASSIYLNDIVGIYVSGRYAYVSSYAPLQTDPVSDRLTVVDVSNPANPRIVGWVQDNTQLNGAIGVFISGRYAYVAADDGDRLTIVELPGLDIPTILTGDIQTGSLEAWENVDVGNDLLVRGGLGVGSGGILSGGPVGITLPATTTTFGPLSSLISLTHATGTFEGVGLLMDFGTSTPLNSVGSFTGKFAQFNNASSTRFFVDHLGRTGVGTSTMASNFYLGVSGDALISGTTTVSGLIATSTLTVLGTATSTFSGGLNILAGGLRVAPGFTSAGNTWLDSNLITVSSSTASSLTISYQSAATSTILDNSYPGFSWTLATSTTAKPIFQIQTFTNRAATTSVFGNFELDGGAFSYNSATGTVSVDSLQTGPMSFDNDAGIVSWIDLPISTTTARLAMSFSAQIDSTPVLTVYGESTSMGQVASTTVGIGTTTPLFLLHLASTTPMLGISDTNATLNNKHWFITNQGGDLSFGTSTDPYTATSSHLVIERGGNVAVTNGALCADDDNTECPNQPVHGRLYSVNATVLTDDVAELMRSNEALEPGDIVVADPDFANDEPRTYEQERRSKNLDTEKALDEIGVKKSTRPYEAAILGVVSTRPGITLGGFEPGEKDYEITLAGRIPVKVSLEGGEIKVGDRITSSSVPGVGMKATSTGPTIGIALENFDGWSEGEDGAEIFENSTKILVFFNLSSGVLDSQIQGGEVIMDGEGESAFWGIDQSSGRIKFISPLDLNDFDIVNVRQILGSAGKWSIDASGKLTAEEVQTKKFCLEDICITKDDLKALLQNAGLGGNPNPSAPPPAEPIENTPENIPEDETSTTTPAEPETPTEPPPPPEPEPAQSPPGSEEPPPAEEPSATTSDETI